MTRIWITACALVMLTSACNKKDEAQPAASANVKSGDKPSEVKPTGLTFANAAEYEAVDGRGDRDVRRR
jgi:hypothetical protein